jgi:hypothetical protein
MRMSYKMISVEKLKQLCYSLVMTCCNDNHVDFDKLITIIDILAQPVELDQISSKDYGADGVGLTHAEVDALAPSVKTEAVEALIDISCCARDRMVEEMIKFYKDDDDLGKNYCAENNCDACMGTDGCMERDEKEKPVKTEAIEKLLSEYCAECGDCCEICADMKAARDELEVIRRQG